jgi:hypothetical protein
MADSICAFCKRPVVNYGDWTLGTTDLCGAQDSHDALPAVLDCRREAVRVRDDRSAELDKALDKSQRDVKSVSSILAKTRELWHKSHDFLLASEVRAVELEAERDEILAAFRAWREEPDIERAFSLHDQLMGELGDALIRAGERA